MTGPRGKEKGSSHATTTEGCGCLRLMAAKAVRRRPVRAPPAEGHRLGGDKHSSAARSAHAHNSRTPTPPAPRAPMLIG